MIVGIDDTDSRKGMCTTYLCALIVDELRERGFSVSTPMLVRLNPAIPFKTRGNGAVSLEVRKPSTSSKLSPAASSEEPAASMESIEPIESWEKYVRSFVIACINDYAEVDDENTHPGAVFAYDSILKEICEDRDKKNILTGFYTSAVKTMLNTEDALRVISALRLDFFAMKNGRGVIGALAALSFNAALRLGISHDITYELLAYRRRERWGTRREIDEESVWKAHLATYPLTWDTVDEENRKIVFAPHSPCPVLFGIRGDSIPSILTARSIIRSEPTEREMIFITNQGTDAHLINFCREAHELEEFQSYVIEGTVVEPPKNLTGGHVVFTIETRCRWNEHRDEKKNVNSARDETCGEKTDETDEKYIDCIAYEPTKQFRDVVRRLMVGDEVIVFGTFKRNTINLEKLCVKSLVRHVVRNPRCPSCGRRMESAGRGQGFRCRQCRTYERKKAVERIERKIKEGFYEVPPSARRHISKPIVRMQLNTLPQHTPLTPLRSHTTHSAHSLKRERL